MVWAGLLCVVLYPGMRQQHTFCYSNVARKFMRQHGGSEDEAGRSAQPTGAPDGAATLGVQTARAALGGARHS
jgi:hypothetical protein